MKCKNCKCSEEDLPLDKESIRAKLCAVYEEIKPLATAIKEELGIDTCFIPVQDKEPDTITLTISIKSSTARLLQQINPDAKLAGIVEDYLDTCDW